MSISYNGYYDCLQPSRQQFDSVNTLQQHKRYKMKTLFHRKGKTIKTVETGEIQTFETLNKAKAASRKLQLANGGMGCGSLVKL